MVEFIASAFKAAGEPSISLRTPVMPDHSA